MAGHNWNIMKEENAKKIFIVRKQHGMDKKWSNL